MFCSLHFTSLHVVSLSLLFLPFSSGLTRTAAAVAVTVAGRRGRRERCDHEPLLPHPHAGQEPGSIAGHAVRDRAQVGGHEQGPGLSSAVMPLSCHPVWLLPVFRDRSPTPTPTPTPTLTVFLTRENPVAVRA